MEVEASSGLECVERGLGVQPRRMKLELVRLYEAKQDKEKVLWLVIPILTCRDLELGVFVVGVLIRRAHHVGPRSGPLIV